MLCVYGLQIHSIWFAMFASVIAPFGGFYASAIKRTYGLKDFDSVIPGHGGVMDRMDCQFITALFTSVYYNTFIRCVVMCRVCLHPPGLLLMLLSLLFILRT